MFCLMFDFMILFMFMQNVVQYKISMILRTAQKLLVHLPFNYKFSSAASAAAIDYYTLLGIEKGATKVQIKRAFKQLTQRVTPDSNPSLFGRLSEAFVILNDDKARDAYDSLVRTRKIGLADLEKSKLKNLTSTSYLAERKAEKQKLVKKAMNLDKFGRYRGGVPQVDGKARGDSAGEPGDLYLPTHLRGFEQIFPDHQVVDSVTAESFKNYHQSEREARTYKPTWITLEVDYDYFFPKHLGWKWRTFRFWFTILIVLPFLSQYVMGLTKRAAFFDAQEKKREKQLALQKKAEEKAKAEAEALRKLQEENVKSE